MPSQSFVSLLGQAGGPEEDAHRGDAVAEADEPEVTHVKTLIPAAWLRRHRRSLRQAAPAAAARQAWRGGPAAAALGPAPRRPGAAGRRAAALDLGTVDDDADDGDVVVVLQKGRPVKKTWGRGAGERPLGRGTVGDDDGGAADVVVPPFGDARGGADADGTVADDGAADVVVPPLGAARGRAACDGDADDGAGDVVVSPFGAARGRGVRGHRGQRRGGSLAAALYGDDAGRGGGTGGGDVAERRNDIVDCFSPGVILHPDSGGGDDVAECGELLRVDTYDLEGVDVGVDRVKHVSRGLKVFLHGNMHEEIRSCAKAFWLRRTARRALLRRLAEDCARFTTEVRRRAAELRSEAAKARLALLRSGDLEGYAEALAATKESRLQEVLEETTRILAELPTPCTGNSAEKPPSQVLRGGELMPHQLCGFRWLAQIVDSRMNGILADDMGLGKTVQVLALIGHLLESRGERGPHLVVVPLSVMHHWAEEMTLWLPDVRFVTFRGPRKDVHMQGLMDELGTGASGANIVLTSYETAVSHREFLSRVPWHLLIVDEGHRLKNIKTRAAQVCHSLPCRRRLLLTGTPLQNSLRELWSLLVFVAPRSFSSLGDFEQWFALPSAQNHRLDGAAGDDAEPPAEVAQSLTEEEELLVIQRLHSVLRPFLLRRTKGAVLKDLPPKREVVIWVPISAWQRTLYQKSLRGARSEGGDAAAKASMMALRKALNHPCHFLPDKERSLEGLRGGGSADCLVRASGKFEFLDRFLPRMWRLGHKVLVFAQMTSLLDLLEALLDRHGLRFARIDGKTSVSGRKDAVRVFRMDPECAVMLLSTRSGGLGLNLQVADTVVMFDSDWNPQVDLQAVDRVHRIGQHNEVLVVRLMTPTAFDQGLLERTGRKRDLERKVIMAGRFHERPEGEEGGAPLLRQLVRDARAAARGQAQACPTATPLQEANQLLARSPEEHAALEEADIALLGPPAPGQAGGEEGAAERLERCGRLLTKQEAKRVPAAALALPKMARRKKEVSAAAMVQRRRQRRQAQHRHR